MRMSPSALIQNLAIGGPRISARPHICDPIQDADDFVIRRQCAYGLAIRKTKTDVATRLLRSLRHNRFFVRSGIRFWVWGGFAAAIRRIVACVVAPGVYHLNYCCKRYYEIHLIKFDKNLSGYHYNK